VAADAPPEGSELARKIATVFEQAKQSVVAVEYVVELSGPRGQQRLTGATMGVVASKSGLVMIPGTALQVSPMNPAFGLVSVDAGKFTWIKVISGTGAKFDASFIGRDEDVNLAFIQVAAGQEFNVPPLAFQHPSLRAGEEVLLVSLLPRKYGYEKKFLLTRINAVVDKPTRLYSAENLPLDFIGSPALTLNGAAVGIVGRDMISVGGSGGLEEFAPNLMILPTSAFWRFILNPPVKKAPKGWLGIEMQALEPDVAEAMGLPQGAKGIIVSRVFKGMGFPAEKAGLQAEDVVTHLDDKLVDVDKPADVAVFRKMVRDAGPRTDVALTVLRNKQPMRLTLNLSETPKTSEEARKVKDERFGFTASEITFDLALARNLSLDIRGVIATSVEHAGWAGLAGLLPGHVIQKINDQEVVNLEGFEKLMDECKKEKRKEVVFFVRHGTETAFIRVEPDWK